MLMTTYRMGVAIGRMRRDVEDLNWLSGLLNSSMLPTMGEIVHAQQQYQEECTVQTLQLEARLEALNIDLPDPDDGFQ